MKTAFDIATRYRMFSVHYFGPGNRFGSRIKLKDLRHNKTKWISYCDTTGRMDDQAVQYLDSIGISVDALGLADKDSDCIFLSLDISTQLK
jgi:hypothetical protein